MGSEKASPASTPRRSPSPPSGGANKNRRPASLSVASNSTSKASSGRPSPARSPVPKKPTSASKATTPPGKSLTSAHGPVLATEARSKVRPCGCSRRHGAGHHHPPETSKEPIRRKPKAEASPVKSPSLSPAKPAQISLTPAAAAPQKSGNNTFVSTLLWVPRHSPSTYSTTLIVSAQHPEVIAVHQNQATVKSAPRNSIKVAPGRLVSPVNKLSMRASVISSSQPSFVQDRS